MDSHSDSSEGQTGVSPELHRRTGFASREMNIPGIHKRFVILVSSVAALGGLLFGYDTAVISGAIGFLQKHFDLSAAATGWAASCALAGCVIGAACAGFFSDHIGRRRVLLLSALMFLLSAVGTAIAPRFFIFVIFRIIGGLGIGAASMASPLYIAEISPARWRGRLVTLNQLAIVGGILLIYLVNFRIAQYGGELWNETMGWRWMFASGALPSIILLVMLFFVPETPRFLVLKGRDDEALRIAARIETGESSGFNIEEIRAVQREGGMSRFQGLALRIVVLGIILACLQQITGINVFLYYAPEIFKHVGSGTNAALMQTVLVGAMNLLFTVVAMLSVDRLGRKPLWIIGGLGMGVCLVAMGIAAMRSDSGKWLLIFVLGYIACFACSLGPVTWVMLSEMFPTRLRGRFMAISAVALWTANFVVSQSFPMLDQNTLLIKKFHHGFPFFLYAFWCFLGAWFVGRHLPETKNRSLEEIERWWIKRSKAVDLG